MANIERLRIVALFSIIGFHATHERMPIIGGIGLPIFLLLTNMFNCTVSERRGYTQFVRDKVNRLLPPLVFWSVVYGAMVCFGAWRKGVYPSELMTPWILVAGTYAHLWFIPFALISGIGVATLQRATTGERNNFWIILCFAGGVALWLTNAFSHAIDPYRFPPVSQWMFSIPSTFFGFAIGRMILTHDGRILRDAVAAMSVCAAICCIVAVTLDLPFVLVRYSAALTLVGAALVWRGKMDRICTIVSPLLLGVYLVHPLVVRLFKSFVWLDGHIFLYSGIVFVISCGVIWVMQRTPLRRFA